MYDTTHVLTMLSLSELAMHQSLTELMSWSKKQSCGEVMTRKIFRSAKIRSLQQLMELDNNNNNYYIIICIIA
jgi:hypothetical protein